MRVIYVPWLKPIMDIFLPDWRAITIGHTVFADSPLSESLIAHEKVHIEQWDRFGISFPVRYFYSSYKAWNLGMHWYWANEYEIEARNRT